MRRERLLILMLACLSGQFLSGQTVPYGNNPAAGNYYNVGDARIYYEIYGKGDPVVMLHGGVYGYIDEFEPLIKSLSEKFRVICIATRAHGKSEAGNSNFSYVQRVEDAYKVIRSITKDSVTLLGFSDGGMSALKLAATHPELVKKLIAIGVGDRSRENGPGKTDYTPEGLMKYDSAFFKRRLAIMTEPARWREILTNLTKMYNEDYMGPETFGAIKCPTMIMSGDRDGYSSMESVVKCAKAIPNSQLAIIPGCYHVVFFCNYPAVWASIQPFLESK